MTTILGENGPEVATQNGWTRDVVPGEIIIFNAIAYDNSARPGVGLKGINN